MTLLSICQGVARSIPVAVPASIAASTENNAMLLLQCAQDEGECLSRRKSGGWVSQILEYTFNTVSGTPDYVLPSDFRAMIDGTLWDRTRLWELRGALSPQEWQLYKSSAIGYASLQRRWRLRVPSGSSAGSPVEFLIDPTPLEIAQVAFEYVSNAWCKSAAGVAQTSWLGDSDTGILDEYLIRLGVKWRFLERLGLDYGKAEAEYYDQVEKAVGRDGGASALCFAPENTSYLLSSANVQETGYG